MAVTKLWPIKGSISGGTASVRKAVASVTDYAENPEKTLAKGSGSVQNAGSTYTLYMNNESGVDATIDNVLSYVERDSATYDKKYVTTINCTEEHSIEEMMGTKQRYNERGNRILWHGYQSFKPGETTADQAHRIGVDMANKLWGEQYEVVVTTHLDKEHIHNHIVINSVSFSDGKKFDWDTEYPRMQKMSDKLCKEAGLSSIKKDELSGHYHRGAVRAKEEGRYTLAEITREDIDCCIFCSSTYEEFLGMMNDKGYRINTEGKYVKVYPPGHDKPIRIDRRWGDDYTMDAIKDRIEFSSEQETPAAEIKPAVPEGKISYDHDDDRLLRAITKDVMSGADLFIMKIPYATLEYLLRDTGIYIPGKYIGREISGLMVGFVKYHLAAGFFRKTPGQIARTHYLLREDLTKLDMYVAETRLLIENDITTEDVLNTFTAAEETKLKKMYDERSRLQNVIRRAKEEDKPDLKTKLKQMNKEVAKQKKKVGYCNDIKKRLIDIPRRISEAVKLQERRKDERTNYYYKWQSDR
ncbi:MAG: relaxase/mobilization nuclease domain-containing protein [Eubacterium sp.]|nr:relaxase/mobilization nuclease domain-containing protein [Eubacterium sp.]